MRAWVDEAAHGIYFLRIAYRLYDHRDGDKQLRQSVHVGRRAAVDGEGRENATNERVYLRAILRGSYEHSYLRQAKHFSSNMLLHPCSVRATPYFAACITTT